MSGSDRISAVLIALLGASVWWHAGSFPTLDDGHPGPALFPRMIGGGLFLAGIGLMLLRRPATTGKTEPTDRFGWLRLLLAIVLVTAFPWMREWIGFVASLTILGFAVAWSLKSRLIIALPVVVISAFLIYGLFTRLLGVPL